MGMLEWKGGTAHSLIGFLFFYIVTANGKFYGLSLCFLAITNALRVSRCIAIKSETFGTLFQLLRSQ